MIRRRVLAQAERIDRLTRDPDLHLVIDGVRVRPQLTANHRFYRFAIRGRGRARSLSLRSRSTVPAEAWPLANDGRRLGVAIERIVARNARGLCSEIGHDCAALSRGFHQDEGSHRWTDGCGYLPEAMVAGWGRNFVLEVVLAETESWYRADLPVTEDAIPPAFDISARLQHGLVSRLRAWG